MDPLRLARAVLRDRPRRRIGRRLGAVDRRPRGRDPGPRDPAVRQADPRLAADAADPARDAEDPDEVQGQERPGVPSGHEQETMDLYKRTGTNPFAPACRSCCSRRSSSRSSGCSTTSRRSPTGQIDPIGPITREVAAQARAVDLLRCPALGQVHRRRRPSTSKIVARRAHHPDVGDDVHHPAPADEKNMPAAALDNPFAKQQKMLLYLMPLFFAISGINFPIGVLLYWLTTNIWSMGQQFYVIRRMPAPGSLAEKALAGAARQARQGGGEVHRQGPGRSRAGSVVRGLAEVHRPAPAAQAEQEAQGRPARGRRRGAPPPRPSPRPAPTTDLTGR